MTCRKKKIVILGSLGMAGHIMAEFLDETDNYEVFGVARQSGRYVDRVLDITDFKELENYLDYIKPDYVINCAGALVSQSRDNLAYAILLNSYLPNFLSQSGEKLGYRLIQISTDCVFSGKDGQYTEASFRDGDDNYARSKALGEVINGKDLTIRTSFIGPELKTNGLGLLDWFFKQRGPVEGYTKVYWSGVTTLELAKAIGQFLEQGTTGLYQFCPKEKISKYALVKLFAKIWNKNVEVVPSEDHEADKSLLCTRHDFNYPTPEYEKMLIELKSWMDKHPAYYAHYEI
ncbi:SDR family oxidoreductase [bacterium]|nr:SDR family oxidoreductase [bacterium]